MNAHPELDRALSAWLERELPSHAPDDLLSEAMAEVARTGRRSSWRIPERWIPMPITLRLVVIPRVAMSLLLLAALLAVLAVAIVSVGSRSTQLSAAVVPPPTGPAANGLIAYDSAGDIWVVNPDGSDPNQLTTSAALEHSPVWSRDGTKLAYWSQDAAGSPSSLIVVDADGTNPRTIATDEAGRTPDNGPGLDWAPDGTHVAYSLGGEGSPRPDEHVYVAAVDESGFEQVGDPTLIGRKPSYSPDGTTIAFTGSREGAAEEGPYPEQGVWLMSSDGGDVRRLTTMDAEDQYEFFRAEWSPDGTKVATSITGDVWVISADGTSERKVTEGYQEAIAPRWSPDGTRLLYASNGPVRVIPVDGGDYVDLGGLGTYGVAGHLWSPDGALVASGQLAGAEIVLAIIDSAGGDVLTEVPTPDLSFPDIVHYPSWQRLAVAP